MRFKNDALRKYCSDFMGKIRQVSLAIGNPYLGGNLKRGDGTQKVSILS